MNSVEKERAERQRGFTLVELLVSMLLTFIVMGAIYSVFRVQTHTVKAQENRMEAQEYARAVLDLMVREIRNAGYAPTGATCAGVVVANAQTLQFRLDANGNGNCSDADEDITYAFDTTGCTGGLGNITRNGSGNPLTDCNVTSDLDLRYFKQDGSELARPVAAGDLPNIQRVLITLNVQSKYPDAEFGGGQLNATMVSNADLRNRGLP